MFLALYKLRVDRKGRDLQVRALESEYPTQSPRTPHQVTRAVISPVQHPNHSAVGLPSMGTITWNKHQLNKIRRDVRWKGLTSTRARHTLGCYLQNQIATLLLLRLFVAETFRYWGILSLSLVLKIFCTWYLCFAWGRDTLHAWTAYLRQKMKTKSVGIYLFAFCSSVVVIFVCSEAVWYSGWCWKGFLGVYGGWN